MIRTGGGEVCAAGSEGAARAHVSSTALRCFFNQGCTIALVTERTRLCAGLTHGWPKEREQHGRAPYAPDRGVAMRDVPPVATMPQAANWPGTGQPYLRSIAPSLPLPPARSPVRSVLFRHGTRCVGIRVGAGRMAGGTRPCGAPGRPSGGGYRMPIDIRQGWNGPCCPIVPAVAPSGDPSRPSRNAGLRLFPRIFCPDGFFQRLCVRGGNRATLAHAHSIPGVHPHFASAETESQVYVSTLA